MTVHHLPAGARDLLPLDVAQKEWVEARLRAVFDRWGYQRIITPTLERLDTLTAGGTVEPQAVLQLRDSDGAALGLRPELTASIARAAATRMAQRVFPQRLYYCANVFRNARQEKEFFQAGVELLGAPGWLADAEIMLLLADCLQELALPDWTLVLGDVGLTESLLSVISPSAQDSVRRAIAQLDQVYLETADLSEGDRQCALQILDLRGHPSHVFRQLTQLALPSAQKQRVQDLKELCEVLTQQGVPFVLDLSLLQTLAITYYTGVVFQVVSGPELLGLGGRYDQLFGLYSPSHTQQAGIGFSLTLEALQRAIAPTAQLPTQLPPPDCLLIPNDVAAIPATLALAQQWRRQPVGEPRQRVEVELLGPGHETPRSPEAIAQYAQRRRIAEMIWVQADGTYHQLLP